MYHHDPFHGHSHFCVEAKFHWLDDVCTHLGSWWCQRRQGKTHCFTTGRPQCGFLEDNDSDGDGGGAEEAWDDFLISVLMTITVPVLMSLLLLEVRLTSIIEASMADANISKFVLECFYLHVIDTGTDNIILCIIKDTDEDLEQGLKCRGNVGDMLVTFCHGSLSSGEKCSDFKMIPMGGMSLLSLGAVGSVLCHWLLSQCWGQKSYKY